MTLIPSRARYRVKRVAQTFVAFLLVPVVLVLCACGGSEQPQLAPEQGVPVHTTAEQPSVWLPVGEHVSRPGGAVTLTVEGLDMYCTAPPVGDDPMFGIDWIAYSGSLVIGHGRAGQNQPGTWSVPSVSGETLVIVVAVAVSSAEPAACSLSGVRVEVQPKPEA